MVRVAINGMGRIGRAACKILMNRHFGIKKAFMTTIHAYTSNQGLVDNPRNKWRRGRAAALNNEFGFSSQMVRVAQALARKM